MPMLWLTAFLAAGSMQLPAQRDLILYNHSPSMSVGLYWRTNFHPSAPLVTGAIVTVRAINASPQMAAARHFDGPRDRFIKRVAAIAGDRVCAKGSTLRINGGRQIVRHTALPFGANDGGRAPIWSGCRALGKDEVLLLGETLDSFDGRYWGPSSLSDIEGVWRPLRP